MEIVRDGEGRIEEEVLAGIGQILESSSREGSHKVSMEGKEIEVSFNVSNNADIGPVLEFVEGVYGNIINIDAIKEGGTAEILIGKNNPIVFDVKEDSNDGYAIMKLAGVALGVENIDDYKDEASLYEPVFAAAKEFISAEDTSDYKVDNFTLKIGDLEIKGLSADFGKIPQK